MELRVLLSTTMCAVALAACGGGSGGDSTASASNDAASETANAGGSSAVNSADQPAEVIASSDEEAAAETAVAAATSTQAVSGSTMEVAQAVTVSDTNANISSNFETDFTKFAPGWTVNWWGTGTTFAGSRETRAGYVHGGTGAQKYTVTALPAGGGAHLIFPLSFQQGGTYSAGVWMRADAATQVEVQLRRDVSPWNVVARQVVSLGTAWQQVNLAGAYPYAEPGSLRIVPLQVGASVYVDDVTVNKQTTTATGGTNLPAAGTAGETLTAVSSSTMEESFTSFAPGWYYNTFGGTAAGVFSASRDSRSGYAHSGAASQRFQVIDKKGGELHLINKPAFVKGKTYRATAWIRADAATQVKFFMRRDDHPYDAFGSKTITATTAWQQVVIEGTYISSAAGSLRASILGATGTIWVDDVKVEEVTRNDMAPYGTGVVADTLFGMHVNKLGVHYVWPNMNNTTIRLHNTGTHWKDLEPTQNGWNWTTGGGKRLDMYVDYAMRNGAKIVYTLGMTPLWASSTPTTSSLYGLGASGAPKDMNDWRDYVRTLATRYVGKIRYWELWNEPDFSLHWVGTPQQLVEMARIAREELKAADPANQLVGPGFTAGQGMAALDQLLGYGIGQYLDMIGYHFYYSTSPEGIGAQLDNVRNLMGNYGVQGKPLFITEGAFLCDSALTDCATAVPTTAQRRSVNARAMFMMADRGVANFNYYIYEATDAWRKLTESDYSTLTEEGRAFGEARGWIKGTKIVDAYRVGDKIYVMRLTRGTETHVVMWATQDNTVVNLPSAWTVTRARTIMGVDSAVPTNRQMTIGMEPVLLRP